MTPRFIVVGLAGGIGSGKSTVASLFEESGASTVDADAIAHRVIGRPEMVRRLARIWGPSILRRGRIHRPSLAAAAFRDAAGVKRLNRAIHPAVGRELRQALRAARRRGGIFVLDAALLMESGISSWCGRIVYVDAPRTLRERRVARRGWSPGELRRRERFQWPAARKRAAADHVVRNGGSLEETRRQVRQLMETLDTELNRRP